MITLQQSAMRQALEALEASNAFVEASANKKLLPGWGEQLDLAERAAAALRQAIEAEQQAEPMACLIRHRVLRTKASVAVDKADHWGEWGDWEPETLPYGRAVTHPSRHGGDCEYQMLPLYTHPQPAQQPAIPPGWKWVPMEPTDDMLSAWFRCARWARDGSWQEAYRDLLAAAPEAPATGLNLSCKSEQKRLATMWGFVPAQQPLTEERILDMSECCTAQHHGIRGDA